MPDITVAVPPKYLSSIVLALVAAGLTTAACETADPAAPNPSSSGSGGEGGGGAAAVSGAAGMNGGTNAGTPSTAGGGAGGGAAPMGGSAGTAGGGSAGSSGSGGGVGAGCTGEALCWDFEDGKLPDGFTAYRNQPNGTLLVDDTKPNGTSKYALHAKDIQGQQPQKSLTFQLPADWGPMLWGRMRVFTTPTRPAAHAGLFAAYYLPVGSSDTAMNKLDWFEVASYTEAYMGIWHPPWPPGFPEAVYVSDTKVVLDKWVCLEWQFDAQNDADPEQAGEPRVWLDGTELAWPQKFGFAEPGGQTPTLPTRHKGTSFTMIEVGMTMWQPMDTPNNWWIDDLGVSPERIGCD